MTQATFTKAIFDSVILDAQRNRPTHIIVSRTFARLYQARQVVWADRQWRKRNWGKASLHG